MNTQNILQNQGSKTDIGLDGSEYFDLELVVLNVESVLDYSEFYDYEIFEEESSIDLVLDSSEFYDYTLGDNAMDYNIPTVTMIDGNYIITKDEFILTTEDKYYIEYY